MRLGIYPGTFDPIHMGHLSFALESIKRCGLDKVIFLPESQPRYKIDVTSPSERLEQIKASIELYPLLDVLLLESSQFSVSQTLPEIQQHFGEAELTLLVGSDVALTLPDWNEITTLVSACDVAIGMRSHQAEHDVQAVISSLQSLVSSCSFTVVHTDHPSLASSEFRKTKSLDKI